MIYYNKLSDRIGTMLIAKFIEFYHWWRTNNHFVTYRYLNQLPEVNFWRLGSPHASDKLTPSQVDSILRFSEAWTEEDGTVTVKILAEVGDHINYYNTIKGLTVEHLSINFDSLIVLYKERYTPEVLEKLQVICDKITELSHEQIKIIVIHITFKINFNHSVTIRAARKQYH